MDAAPPSPPDCRLCGGTTHFFHRDKRRPYYKCENCYMVVVPEECFLSEEEEKKEYDFHQNSNLDDGYRAFLSRAAEPLRRHIDSLSAPADGTQREQPVGLDFGSGPFPALATLLESPPYDYRVLLFDKYYCPTTAHLLDEPNSLDFVTATEVVEHLKDPLPTIRRLWRALKPNGVLVVMTKRVDGSIEKFRNWHYIRDPTHITFFHEKSFLWLGHALPNVSSETCEVIFVSSDVVLLTKRCH